MICPTRPDRQWATARSRRPRSSSAEPRSSRHRPELGDHSAGQADQVDVLALDLHRVGVELGEVEQVGRQLLQPLDLLAHRLS